MRSINNKTLATVLATIIVALGAWAYLTADTVAQTSPSPTIGLNSPTTFPVDI